MSKHTPGPWSVYIEVPGSPPRIVAGALRNDIGGCTYKADARLIAAAPDLATALQECVAAYVAVDHANTYTSDDVLSIVKANERIRAAQKAARAALAKAGL